MSTRPIEPAGGAAADAAGASDKQSDGKQFSGKQFPDRRFAGKGFAGEDLGDKQFPEFPPRDDINNSLILDEPGWQPALRRKLAEEHPRLLVISEMPLGWSHDQRSGILIPDLMIVFDVDPVPIIRQRGYAIDEWRKSPDFVLEIASIHTARNDERGKREAYARYRVTEYWRFDATGGEYYASGLAADRARPDGVGTDPVEIHRAGDGSLWGHSLVLNLDLCWEQGRLRWYDPGTGRYLDTYDEEADGRIAERARRIIAEGERDEERAARIAEQMARMAEEEARRIIEGNLDAERAARIAERAARMAEEEARIAERATLRAEQEARRAAESEARRLQEIIRRLRQEPGQ